MRIVLSTINARYIHASLGLRYLWANLGLYQQHAVLKEFVIQDRPVDIAERILAESPTVIGFGVYIWNATITAQVVSILKSIAPDVTIVLGGPEVSHETENQPIVTMADFTIKGEGDVAFAALLRRLDTEDRKTLPKIIAAPLPDLAALALPYASYSAHDLAHRVLYVEVSRGCPFRCEFCLSSLDQAVRKFDLDVLLAAFEDLMQRGARQFKFVDRTFNLSLPVAEAILAFFWERRHRGLFLHFEMVPDRLPDALRAWLARFDPGTVQLEIGIQSFNPDVMARIARRQDLGRLADNLRFLRTQTAVHLHTDLIIGLPGETIQSIATGFDQLIALNPQEIQVGILKRLRGTPIARHQDEWQMVYSAEPPYELLQSKTLDFATMQRLKRFSRYWDLVANSGNFAATVPLLWQCGGAFENFLRFSDWLFAQTQRTHGIELERLAALLFRFLVEQMRQPAHTVADVILTDYAGRGRRIPAELRPFITTHEKSLLPTKRPPSATATPTRQMRHL